MRKSPLAVVAALALAGCGGGGGGSVAPAQPVVVPTTAPTTTPLGSMQSAKLTLRFPVSTGGTKSHARNPKFVDATNAAALVTIINTYNGSATLPSWLAAYATTTVALSTSGGSPNCAVSAGIETCTVTVPAPPGSVNYTFNVTDAASTVLSTNTATESIAQGTTTVINNVTLQGVLASATIAPAVLTANVPQSAALGITIADPDGATITGSTTPYNGSSVTLTSNSAHLQLSVGGAYAASVVIATPGDAANLTFSYDGEALAANAITLTATKTSDASTLGTVSLSTINSAATFSGLTVADSAHGATSGQPNYNQPTEFFATTGQTQSLVTASELGFTNAPYNLALTATADAGCGSIISGVSIGAPSGGSQTITVTSGPTPGICKINVSDGLGDDTFYWTSVSAASFGVN